MRCGHVPHQHSGFGDHDEPPAVVTCISVELCRHIHELTQGYGNVEQWSFWLWPGLRRACVKRTEDIPSGRNRVMMDTGCQR